MLAAPDPQFNSPVHIQVRMSVPTLGFIRSLSLTAKRGCVPWTMRLGRALTLGSVHLLRIFASWASAGWPRSHRNSDSAPPTLPDTTKYGDQAKQNIGTANSCFENLDYRSTSGNSSQISAAQGTLTWFVGSENDVSPSFCPPPHVEVDPSTLGGYTSESQPSSEGASSRSSPACERCGVTAATCVSRASAMAQRLTRELKKEILRFPPGISWNRYIPADYIARLTSKDSVRHILNENPLVLKGQIDHYVDKVHKDAPKVFAILTYMGRLDSLKELLDGCFVDSDLPVSSLDGRLKSHDGRVLQSFNNVDWVEDDLDTFAEKQWLVLSPVFSTPGGHMVLHSDCVLPFTFKEECGKGAFSHVYAVRMHPAHQKLCHLKGDDNPMLALKTLKDRPQTGDADFHKETVMLRSVMQLDHPHIIKLLATFHHENSYNMLFLKASSNLRKYWIDHDSHQLSHKYILWIFKQLHGLASGISKIHNFRVPSDKLSSAALSPVVPSDEDRLGRHHDLKPENVLWFQTIAGLDDDKEGVLQIADFGLGKFHSQRSGSRTRTMAGTPAYEPPEARLKGEVSRPYDIWSLGCVFLEFLVWLLFNFKGLEDFGTERKAIVENSFRDDAFFIVESGKAKLRHPVKEWIQKLRDEPRCEGLLASLLSLVENELLNVDPDARIKADRLEQRMRDILNRAKNDPSSLVAISRLSTTPEPGPQHRLVPPSPLPMSQRSQRSGLGAGAGANGGDKRGRYASTDPGIVPPVQILVDPPSG